MPITMKNVPNSKSNILNGKNKSNNSTHPITNVSNGIFQGCFLRIFPPALYRDNTLYSYSANLVYISDLLYSLLVITIKSEPFLTLIPTSEPMNSLLVPIANVLVTVALSSRYFAPVIVTPSQISE